MKQEPKPDRGLEINQLKLDMVIRVSSVMSGLYDIEKRKDIKETVPILREKLDQLLKDIEKLG